MAVDRYRKRSLVIREDNIDKLDKISLVAKTTTSEVVNEALDMYFNVLSTNIATLAKEDGATEEDEVVVSPEEISGD